MSELITRRTFLKAAGTAMAACWQAAEMERMLPPRIIWLLLPLIIPIWLILALLLQISAP